MKKIFLILLAFVVMFAGCKQDDPTPAPSDPTQGGGSGKEQTGEIKAPVVNWQKVKLLATGFRTMFVELKNPNNVALDFTFDVDFLDANGNVVGSFEGLFYNALGAGEKGVCWSNWQIPSAATDLTVKNMRFNKSVYTAVPMTILSKEETPSNLKVIYQINKSFSDANTIVLFYSGNEIVAFDTYTFFNDDVLEHDYEVSESHDKYVIYTNAY